jgi:hypothetical protein
MWTGLYVNWTICELDYMWTGLYVNWTICELNYMWTGLYVNWTICELDYMWTGLYVNWTTCELDYMWTGLHVNWTTCELDYMWTGLYVNCTICELHYMWTGLYVYLRTPLPVSVQGAFFKFIIWNVYKSKIQKGFLLKSFKHITIFICSLNEQVNIVKWQMTNFNSIYHSKITLYLDIHVCC